MARHEPVSGKERRRHTRFPVDKKLTANTRGGRYPGRLRDISAGGAGVYLDDSVDESLDVGDDVTLDIEEFGAHPGHVVGPTRFDLIPIAFDNDEEEQDQLIAEIMRSQSGMAPDEL